MDHSGPNFCASWRACRRDGGANVVGNVNYYEQNDVDNNELFLTEQGDYILLTRDENILLFLDALTGKLLFEKVYGLSCI